MDTSERAQQYSIEDKQCIKSEVKTLGFVTNAGYKATLQRMVSKEIKDETTEDNDVSCQTNRGIMVPTDNSKRQSISRFRRMLSTGSARSTESTTNLSDSSVSGSMASSKSWQSFSNLLDALELLPDNVDNTNNNESINANLAPRKRSDASLTKEQQDKLRQEIKSLSSQNDMLMRRMLFDDPRHELIIPQQSTKCRKSDDGIDHSTQQQLQVPIEVMTATKDEEEEGEQFDPQVFLDDSIYGKKKGGSYLDEKKSMGSDDTDSKKVEPISFPNSNRPNKADEESENDSISLPSSNDSFKDGDDCSLSWPKLKDDSDDR